MGICQGVSKVQEENEILMAKKETHQHESLRDSCTQSEAYQTNILKLDDSIAEEIQLMNIFRPKFIEDKQINNPIKPRMNRFIQDLEDEVRRRIQNIQQEQQQQIEVARMQFLRDLYRQQYSNSQKEFVDQFSFSNSDSNNNNNLSNIAGPHQPKNSSQFAPKKDGDSVSQKSQISQISKTKVSKQSQSPKQGDAIKKTAFKQLQSMKDEIHTNNASNGGSNTNMKKMKVDAFEKMFSEYYSNDKDRSRSNSNSLARKSILKKMSQSNRSIPICKRANSVKSTHTQMQHSKSKKVRFSNDTNFNNERKSVAPVKKRWFEF